MSKFAAIVSLLAVVSLQATATGVSSEIKRALASIPTASGQNALQRMRSCGITFADGSWIEKQTEAHSKIGAQAGDTILEVYINVPPMPGDDGPEARTVYNDLFAQWIIRDDKAIPISGWAKALQQSPVPLRSSSWLNC